MTNTKTVTVELTQDMIENLKMIIGCEGDMLNALYALNKNDSEDTREARNEVSRGVRFLQSLVESAK